MSVAIMSDHQHGHHTPFQNSTPPATWGQMPHVYPHSHHGTPAQEYSGFNFDLAQHPLPVDQHAYQFPYQQRPMAQQLPALVTMPPWPSMISNQSSLQNYPVAYPPQPMQQSVQSLPLSTPISAGGSRSATTPRKTLTDVDKRRMCQYAEEYPKAKQTEIGTKFGVERSTVSKVLRHKEKWLLTDDGSHSPIKRPKGRSPDVERALAVWAKNQERKGLPLTDDLIREKARAFSTTSLSPDGGPVLSPTWIERFKLNNNLLGARSRIGSLAPEDIEANSRAHSIAPTPGGISPESPHGHSPHPLHGVRSHDSFMARSPDSYMDHTTRSMALHSQSHGSLSSAFTDPATHSFSPGPMSPTSPLFTPDSATAPGPFIPMLNRSIVPSTVRDAPHRPRSQTFPMLDFVPSSAESDESTPRYTTSSQQMLDSPMDEPPEDPLQHLNSTLHHMHSSNSLAPADSMGPPPVPSMASREARQGSIGTAITTYDNSQMVAATTPDEARRALEVVLGFFEQQPSGYLDFQESVTIGKLMEKLKLSSRNI